MVSHTTIVFTRYILLEWVRRERNDQKTYGELFYLFCDDIQDMDLVTALQSLMALLQDLHSSLPDVLKKVIACQAANWMHAQPAFIQALFADSCWES